MGAQNFTLASKSPPMGIFCIKFCIFERIFFWQAKI